MNSQLHGVIVWLACLGLQREIGVSQALQLRTPEGYAQYVLDAYALFASRKA